jgi:dienelactone hydrolase
MKKYLILIILILLSFFLGFFVTDWLKKNKIEAPIIQQIKPRTLDRYSIENLINTSAPESEIKLGEVIKEEKVFTSYLFTFSFDPTLTKGPKKTVSGLINIPTGKGPFPIIVMFRGYVDQKIYETGMGTQRAGEYFASNGFITIAPDFLGYAGSDGESSDIFESRFQTYTTAISLLSSMNSVGQWNQKDVFIWGHSNGGHLALAMLEITGKDYPTVLWAPVSQSFPYSILYYLDEAEDGGKLIIQELSDFFNLYDPKLYSITNYFDKINKETVIQLHQGGADEAVPYKWSSNLSKILKNNEIKVNYYYYPGADHNLQPNWNQVVARDLSFFRSLIH